MVFILNFGLFSSAVADISSGLIAHYKFDGNASDSSGNENNGAVNGAVLTSDRFGNSNSAYSFDGISDYIKIESSGTLSVSKITVSSWIKLEQNIGNTQARIICRQNTNGGKESWGLEIFGNGYSSSTGNNLTFHSGNGSDAKKLISPVNLEAGKWYHVVAVNDGNNQSIYINANLSSVTPSTGNVYSSNNAPIHIGKTNPGNTFFFPGDIDDIRIYNRALSDSEIQELYQGETSCTSSKAGTVSSNLDIHMPSLDYQTLFGTQNIWVDFEYSHEENGKLYWSLKDYGAN